MVSQGYSIWYPSRWHKIFVEGGVKKKYAGGGILKKVIVGGGRKNMQGGGGKKICGSDGQQFFSIPPSSGSQMVSPLVNIMHGILHIEDLL